MTCDECRHALLEASPAELRAMLADSAHPHLAGCRNCRTLADAALLQHERLAAALAQVETRHAAVELEAIARERRHRRPGARSVRWPRRTALALLPAAAAAAVILLTRELPRAAEPLDPPPEQLYATLHPTPPTVRTPPGVRAAVIRTDRDLTLVLLYQEEVLR